MNQMIEVVPPGDLLIKLYRQSGGDLKIVTGFGAKPYGESVPKFISTFNKNTYIKWLSSRCGGDIIPDEVEEKTATISSGSASINFNDKIYNIVGYEIAIGYGDQVGLGNSVKFVHTKKDFNGVSQNFEFSLRPSGQVSYALYLENFRKESKAIPGVVKTNIFTPTAADTNAKGTSSFAITGRNDVSVSILPICELSDELGALMNVLPKIERAFMAAA